MRAFRLTMTGLVNNHMGDLRNARAMRLWIYCHKSFLDLITWLNRWEGSTGSATSGQETACDLGGARTGSSAGTQRRRFYIV